MKTLSSIIVGSAFAVALLFSIGKPHTYRPDAAAPSTVTTPAAPDEDLVEPASLHNDCAIVATVAFELLRPTGVWTRIILVRFEGRDGATFGHALTVWQIFPGSQVLIFDQNGTIDLSAHTRSIDAIVKALGEVYDPKVLRVISARFVD